MSFAAKLLVKVLVAVVFIPLLLTLLFSCSSKVVVQKVPVGVFVRLERPERPVRAENEKLAPYFVRVLNYTEKLETIIDGHNKYASVDENPKNTWDD